MILIIKMLVAFRQSHSRLTMKQLVCVFMNKGWRGQKLAGGHVIKGNDNDSALLLKTKNSTSIVKVFKRRVSFLEAKRLNFSLFFLKLPVSASRLQKSVQFIIYYPKCRCLNLRFSTIVGDKSLLICSQQTQLW